MTVYHPQEHTWAKRVGQISAGLGMIKTGIDVGKSLWSAGSAVAPYILAAIA